MGAGVAACYRGSRVYDTEETKAVVKKWVDFYKVTTGTWFFIPGLLALYPINFSSTGTF